MIESGAVQIDLVLSGRSVEGRISVDYLSVLAKEMQTTLRRLASNKQEVSGRYTKDIERACSLELVGFSAGSVRLCFELARVPADEQELQPDAGRASIERFFGLIEAGERGAGWDEELPSPVLDGLDRMTRSLDDGVDSIEVSVRGGGLASRTVRLTKAFRESIRPGVGAGEDPRLGRVVGVIWEADWKRHTAELHEADGRVVEVRFDAGRDEAVTEARRRKVAVTGIVSGNGRRRSIELRRLEVLDEHELSEDALPGSFWDRSSVEELAAQQGVGVVEDIDALAGDWPEDEDLDAFLDMVREGRG